MACDTFCVGESINASKLTEGLQSMATGWAPDRFRFSPTAERPKELSTSRLLLLDWPLAGDCRIRIFFFMIAFSRIKSIAWKTTGRSVLRFTVKHSVFLAKNWNEEQLILLSKTWPNPSLLVWSSADLSHISGKTIHPAKVLSVENLQSSESE